MLSFNRERQTASRSALRYRPITSGQAPAGQATTHTRKSRPDARVTTAPVPPDDLDLEEERVPNRRLTAPAHQARKKLRMHPLFFIGIGILVTLLLWVGITQSIAWGTNEYNTVVYGYPRTFQIDAVVGHNDSAQHPSHFMAVNLHGSINIIEFPGSDPSRARVFVFSNSLGSDADLAVVTLRFVDVNHSGQPDMAIDIGGVQGVLINDGKTFRLPTSVEQQQVLLFLQQHP